MHTFREEKSSLFDAFIRECLHVISSLFGQTNDSILIYGLIIRLVMPGKPAKPSKPAKNTRRTKAFFFACVHLILTALISFPKTSKGQEAGDFFPKNFAVLGAEAQKEVLTQVSSTSTCDRAPYMYIEAFSSFHKSVVSYAEERILRCGKRAVPALVECLQATSFEAKKKGACALPLAIIDKEAAIKWLPPLMGYGEAEAREQIRNALRRVLLHSDPKRVKQALFGPWATEPADGQKMIHPSSASEIDRRRKLDTLRVFFSEENASTLIQEPSTRLLLATWLNDLLFYSQNVAQGSREKQEARDTRYLLVPPLAKWIGSSQDPALSQALEKKYADLLTKDPEAMIRAEAAKQAPLPRFVYEVTQLMLDPHPRVRAEAAARIAFLKADALEPALKILKDEAFSFVKVKLASALSAIEPKKIFPKKEARELILVMNQSDLAFVRNESIRAIGVWCISDRMQALKDEFMKQGLKPSATTEEIEQSLIAFESLAMISPKEAASFLQDRGDLNENWKKIAVQKWKGIMDSRHSEGSDMCTR